MTRRRRKAIAAALAAVALAVANDTALAADPSPLFEQPPRGVILLVADDLGSGFLGTDGDPMQRSPHLDRLAAEGTQFPLAFASSSTCSPSRATLYTGLPSHQSGQYGIAHGTSHFAQFDDVVTLPEALRLAGTFVGWIGKSHVLPESKYPADWEWDGDRRDPAQIAAAAADFFRAASGKRFLLVVGFADAHRDFGVAREDAGENAFLEDARTVALPRILPDRIKIREEIALYRQAIRRLDRAVGALLETLETSGREDDALVIFTSDNGSPFPGAKTNLSDEGIRLPLSIRNPVQIRRGIVCEAMVSGVDVVPTALEWLRVEKPRTSKAKGRSLLRILEESSPPEWNEIFASQSFHEVTMYYPMRAVRTRTHKLILNLAHPLPFPIAEDVFASTTWQGIAHHPDPTLGDRPLSAYLQRPRVELYDLLVDPAERTNLAEDPALGGVRRDLEGRVRDWQERTDDPWFVKYIHE